MVNIGSLTLKDEEFLDDFVESFEARKIIYTEDLLKKHLNSPLKIYVKTADIKFQCSGMYELIPCKAEIVNEKADFQNKVEIDCFVAFGKWNLFWDIKGERFNIFDYFHRFFSNHGKGIGLVTFQNGIQNKLEDLKKMGESIKDGIPFPHKPLCIGFLNESNGLLDKGNAAGIKDDLFRLLNPWFLNPKSILTLRQLIYTLASEQMVIPSNVPKSQSFLKQDPLLKPRSVFSLPNTTPLLPPHVRWVHVAHSEGGLLAKKATTPCIKHPCGLQTREQEFIKKHLIVSTFGAVKPVPNVALDNVNTYSCYDVTMNLIAKYVKDEHLQLPDDKTVQAVSAKIASFPRVYTRKNTTVTIIASLLAKENVPLIKGDHDFQGTTYRAAVRSNLAKLIEKHNILWPL